MADERSAVPGSESMYFGDIDRGASALLLLNNDARVRQRQRLGIQEDNYSDEDAPGLDIQTGDYTKDASFLQKLAYGVKRMADCLRKKRCTKVPDNIKMAWGCCPPEFHSRSVVRIPVRYKESVGDTSNRGYWKSGVLVFGPESSSDDTQTQTKSIFKTTQVDLQSDVTQSVRVFLLVPFEIFTLKTGKKYSGKYFYYQWSFLYKPKETWLKVCWKIRVSHPWEEFYIHAMAATMYPRTYTEEMKDRFLELEAHVPEEVRKWLKPCFTEILEVREQAALEADAREAAEREAAARESAARESAAREAAALEALAVAPGSIVASTPGDSTPRLSSTELTSLRDNATRLLSAVNLQQISRFIAIWPSFSDCTEILERRNNDGRCMCHSASHNEDSVSENDTNDQSWFLFDQFDLFEENSIEIINMEMENAEDTEEASRPRSVLTLPIVNLVALQEDMQGGGDQ